MAEKLKHPVRPKKEDNPWYGVFTGRPGEWIQPTYTMSWGSTGTQANNTTTWTYVQATNDDTTGSWR